jgi:hypothetical protein
VPRIASRFLDAEVKQFAMSERDAALQWIGDVAA